MRVTVLPAVQVAVTALLLACSSAEANSGARTLLQRTAVASRSSASGTTTSSTGSGGGSGSSSNSGGGGSGGASPRTFDPLGPSPFTDTQCKVLPKGQTYDVNGYPSSPFPTAPFVFVQRFQPLKLLKPSVDKTCNTAGHCIEGYEISIEEVMIDFGLNGTACEGPSVPMLGYNGLVPGPFIDRVQGVPHVTRFTHNVSPDSKYYPPAGPGDAGSDETKDICGDRAERMAHYSKLPPGTGRGFSVHHHGQASTSDMDGWAEQYTCAGETKDYVIPNNRPATLWYHDHAVGTTSANVFAGLAGMLVVRGCSGDQDPFKVEGDAHQPPVTEHQLMLGDYVLSAPRAGEKGVCRLNYDRLGVHKDDLWGDINAVNAVPWPVLDIDATWIRFRILGASVSRPWILQLWDAAGTEVSSKICKIIGSDGGFAGAAVPWPADGLLTDAAYRWDVVCNFTAYAHTPIYLINKPNAAQTTGLTPFFCHSHLIMKINVGGPNANAGVPSVTPDVINGERLTGPLPQNTLQTYQQRALKGGFDRQLEFGKSGLWVFNGRGWDYKDGNLPGKPHIEYDDVGQNTIELWNLKAGGGWIHPIHVHLIDFFCAAVKTSGWQPCPPEYNNIPKDVMHIGANVQEIAVVARYGPHLGEYMMHCHNGVHEDHEMMRAFMVSDSIGSKTFKTTPPFDAKLLKNSPSEAEMQWGDWRNTTYDTATAPPFTTDHVTMLQKRGYYDVFYPPTGSPLDDPSANFWLPNCPRAIFK